MLTKVGRDESDGDPDTGEPDRCGAAYGYQNGWQVRSDHFFVTTNHSLAAGANWWAGSNGFIRFGATVLPASIILKGIRRPVCRRADSARAGAPVSSGLSSQPRDYINNLSRRQPDDCHTLGIYFDTNSEAHFFAG